MLKLEQRSIMPVIKLVTLATTLFITACSPPILLNTFDAMDSFAGSVNDIRSTNPSPIGLALKDKVIPSIYQFNGRDKDTNAFLKKSGTAGLVIIHNGHIINETYYHGKSQDTLFASWSVAKSFTSALIGIAIDEGHIKSVNDLVANYVPALANTAYASATIEDVLEMASGVTFVESYMIGTDVFNLQLAVTNDLAKETLSYQDLDHEPGSFNAYKSLDTQVLGMVLSAATGQSVSSYLESRLWGPAGMTNDAKWLTDRNGMEATFCCMKATTRDFAKLGLIYLNKGFYNNQQIVPTEWVQDSLDISKPHLQPGDNPQSDYDWGYGYQWWFQDNSGDYAAIGIFNQFVYVDPELNLVIAKNSAAPGYLLNDLENEHFALFRAIGRQIANQLDQ